MCILYLQAGHDVSNSSSKGGKGHASAPERREFPMKRTRSATGEAAGLPSKAKKKKGKGLGDIKSPTSRTLLRMLRVGTGETTPNNTSKAEAEDHIRRLAGEYTPEVALAKRYAGREALQELLSNYIGRQITFQQAYECFDNPHNRGLQATPALHALLAGRKWPPYPENALCSVAPAADEEMDELQKEHAEKPELEAGSHELDSCLLRSHELMMALEQHPGVKLPESASHVQRDRIPFGQAVTTGAISSELVAYSSRDCGREEQETGFAAVTRPVITTGFSKFGTPFQAESEMSGYTRQLGVHSAVLELRSFQLLTHNLNPPAAIVAIRRRPSGCQAGSELHVETPISLKSLRCSNMADVRPRNTCLAPLLPLRGSAATADSGGVRALAGNV